MKIHEIIAAVTAELLTQASVAPKFERGSGYWINFNQDEVLNDIVWLHWPVKSNNSMGGGGKFQSPHMEEVYKIAVSFLQKAYLDENAELDWTPEQHQPLIDHQRDQCKKFFAKLSQRQDVVQTSNIVIEDVINIFDRNMTGVVCAFDVEIIDQLNVC
jgi:transcriptional/translational regulatory protein YebC/TACO1